MRDPRDRQRPLLPPKYVPNYVFVNTIITLFQFHLKIICQALNCNDQEGSIWKKKINKPKEKQ